MMLTCTSQPWARISSTKAVTRPKRVRGTSSETSRRTTSSSLAIAFDLILLDEAEHAVVQSFDVAIEHLGAQVSVQVVGHADIAMAHDALHGVHRGTLLAQEPREVVAQTVERAVSEAWDLRARLLVFVEQTVRGFGPADLLHATTTSTLDPRAGKYVRQPFGGMDGRAFPGRSGVAVHLLQTVALFFQ